MPTHVEIVAAARGWLGTRFHHQGRLKKTATHRGGVDCLGLLSGVAGELNLHGPYNQPLTELDRTDYTHFPDTAALQQKLEEHLQPIDQADIAPGDVLLLEITGRPQHMAIVSDVGGALHMIHAYAPARAVVEHALDDYWKKRIRAAYRPY